MFTFWGLRKTHHFSVYPFKCKWTAANTDGGALRTQTNIYVIPYTDAIKINHPLVSDAGILLYMKSFLNGTRQSKLSFIFH